MNVITVPCLFDNYAYLLVDEADGSAVVVDPSEGTPILRKLDALGLRLSAVLCTHHHGDHVGGLPELLERFPGVGVHAHERDLDRIPGVTHTVRHKDELRVGAFAFKALHVPGHTLGAVTWIVEGVAFTGDTLFVAGCGRVFEGTAKSMYASLNDVLGGLPDDTKIYCGHEYTAANLRFAKHVDANNAAIDQLIERVQAQRAAGEPTVPSTMAQERETNPFLRCAVPALVDFAREHDAGGVDPVTVFAAVRAAKNTFKG